MAGKENAVLGVIPARYGSTRFPGKPLTDILDRPMIQWVVEAAESAEEIDRVVVATDDERIKDAVESFGSRAEITPEDCPSGSDRVATVTERHECDYVVNIQGDEPLIRGRELDRGIRDVKSDDRARMGSFMAGVAVPDENNPDNVKVVVDDDNRALYFSRSPVPYERKETDRYFHHIGIYIFEADFLFTFRNWDQTRLEQVESLEQLRALEHGGDIKMTELDAPTVGVDRPGDVEHVEQILRERGYS